MKIYLFLIIEFLFYSLVNVYVCLKCFLSHNLFVMQKKKEFFCKLSEVRNLKTFIIPNIYGDGTCNEYTCNILLRVDFGVQIKNDCKHS